MADAFNVIFDLLVAIPWYATPDFVVFALAALCVFYVLYKAYTKLTEGFTVSTTYRQTEWITDVRFLIGYIGPYLTQAYMYLRAMYSDGLRNRPMPPLYIPQKQDASLKDPNLQFVRSQIKNFVNTWFEQIKLKYSAAEIETFGRLWNLTYNENADGTLTVVFTRNGQSQSFLV